MDLDLVAGLCLAGALSKGEDFGLEVLWTLLVCCPRHACTSTGVTCLVVDDVGEGGCGQRKE